MGRILILGAGVGGTVVANRLARLREPWEIVVACSYPDHLFQPGFLYIPFRKGVPRLAGDERSLLHRNVQFLVERAVRIDPDRRRVEFESGRALDYDWLVIATGARMDHDRVPGAREASHHFHCRKAAERLAGALEDFKGGRIVVGAASLPYKCPPSLHEFTLLLDAWLCDRGLRAATTLSFVYPLPDVLPLEPVARAVRPLLEEAGVEIHTGFATSSIDPVRRTVSSNGTSLPFDLLVLVPPHTGSPAMRNSGLADAGGWVPTDPATLKVAERIYALGDATNLPRPKSGSAAHFQAEVVAANVAAEVRGRKPEARYDGRALCFLETGRHRAVPIEFTYEKPPTGRAPTRLGYWRKRLFSRLYFRLIKRF